MELTAEQQAAVEHLGNAVVIGGPGTGRTTTLIERVAHLQERGAPDGTIHVVTFSWRSCQYVTNQLLETLGNSAEGVVCGTMRDFARDAIEAAVGQQPQIAEFLTIRRLLREAMQEVEFTGTVDEAEHAVLKFKSHAQKPDTSDPHYALLESYQKLLDAQNLTDRHDIVRTHVQGIVKGAMEPVKAKYLLVDNVQDATQIQIIWLLEHIKAGAVFTVFGNDDETAFGRDGAVGSEGFKKLQETEKTRTFNLTQDFVTTGDLAERAAKVLKPLENNIAKGATHVRQDKTLFHVEQCPNSGGEIKFVLEKIPALLQTNDRIAIITELDRHALHIERALQRAHLVHSSFAQSLWRSPGALVIMDLLHVLLNQATNNQLRNVFIGCGFPKTLVDALFLGGLLAEDWIKDPEQRPALSDVPQATLEKYGSFCRKMRGLYQAMTDWKTSPRDVFKAAAMDVLENMHEDEREAALLAIDAMMDMKGKLTEFLPKLRQRRSPNSNAQLVVSTVEEVRNMSFDHVFLPFIQQGIWPYEGYKTLPVDEESDRRRFYFAMTRARKSLICTYSGTPSKFLTEIS